MESTWSIFTKRRQRFTKPLDIVNKELIELLEDTSRYVLAVASNQTTNESGYDYRTNGPDNAYAWGSIDGGIQMARRCSRLIEAVQKEFDNETTSNSQKNR